MANRFGNALAAAGKNAYAGFVSDFVTIRNADAPANLVRNKCAAKIAVGLLTGFAGMHTNSIGLVLGGAYNFLDVFYTVGVHAGSPTIPKTVIVDLPLRFADSMRKRIEVQ